MALRHEWWLRFFLRFFPQNINRCLHLQQEQWILMTTKSIVPCNNWCLLAESCKATHL